MGFFSIDTKLVYVLPYFEASARFGDVEDA